MKVKLTSPAKKQLKKIPKRNQTNIIQKLRLLEQNPYSGKPLLGKYQGLRSLRSWPYRIIYQFNKDFILVLSIAHCQGAFH